jgi:dihydrofolate reductase
MISLIVAMDQNRLIGKDNDLPWRLPEDLKYFKRITTGHTVVMGRKTFESIGRPLPNRENVVLTHQKDYKKEGATVIHSVEELEALDAEKEDELFVIGGATLYEQTLDVANRLYITHFPAVNLSEWKVVSQTQGIQDEKNPYTYYFTVYERS